ncbi:MAG: hypothetical protein LBG27_12505 [Spirochaetaceae bacterium]|nr:hypothetical protein [Spirochaetaceae bacterium]
MKKILFVSLVFASAYILMAQQSENGGEFRTGAFDNNALSGSSSPTQKGTTSARPFTIEPAHSETVYQPKSNQPALEKVDIIVVPSYNPLQPSARPNSSIVTVRQSPNVSPATTTPAVRANPTANSPVQSGQLPQPPYAQSQQLYGYMQNTPPPSNSANRLNVIPENTIDLTTGQSKASVVTESPEEDKDMPIKLYMTETYRIGRNPVPR